MNCSTVFIICDHRLLFVFVVDTSSCSSTFFLDSGQWVSCASSFYHELASKM